MKKFVLSLILSIVMCSNFAVFASEIEEDYLDIAASYCVTGDYEVAIEYLDKILTINPDNTKVLDLKKGLLHVLAKDKKTFITSVNPHVKQAQEYKRIGNDKKELASLEDGIKSKNSYLAYYYLGNYYRDKDEYLKALDAYNNALSAKADFAQAYLSSAITLFDVKRYESVLNPIDKYLTFNPEDDFAYAIKSRAEFELGLLDEAKKDNDKAIELNDCSEYQFDRAKILYINEDYQSAKEIFSSLLSDIQTSKIYEYIGLCDFAMENYMSALINIDRALILSDDDEYLKDKYNEIKEILESNNNEKT